MGGTQLNRIRGALLCAGHRVLTQCPHTKMLSEVSTLNMGLIGRNEEGPLAWSVHMCTHYVHALRAGQGGLCLIIIIFIF